MKKALVVLAVLALRGCVDTNIVNPDKAVDEMCRVVPEALLENVT